MQKKIFALSLVIALVASATSAFAARPMDLPEQAGVYDVPGEPHVKLKVIVYHGKPETNPAKPSATTPTEVCNLPDTDSSTQTLIGGWKLPGNWTYRLNAASAPSSIGAAEASVLAANAFGAWNAAVLGVSITSGPATTKTKAVRDNENIVSWGRTSGTALATTYIWYDTSVTPHRVLEIDMIMNNKFAWEWSNPATWEGRTSSGTTCAYQNLYDAQNIMTHEVGHWFGLDDAYTADFADNTMYGYGSKTETKKNSLTTGDVAALNAIY